MDKFIILHTTDDEYYYTKSLTVNQDGDLVTADGHALPTARVHTIGTGYDPRPMEIRPDVREANGLPPLEGS